MHRPPGQILAYSTRANSRPFSWKRFWVGIAAVFFLCYLVLGVAAPWHSWTISVCKKCAIHERTTDYYLPLTHIPINHSRTLGPTPLSTVIAKHGLCPSHQHQFVPAYHSSVTWFYRGCGGRRIDAVHTAAFIDQVGQYSDAATASKWVRIVLNPDRDRRNDDELWSVPPTGFGNQQSFQAWWALHKSTLDWLSRP